MRSGLTASGLSALLTYGRMNRCCALRDAAVAFGMSVTAPFVRSFGSWHVALGDGLLCDRAKRGFWVVAGELTGDPIGRWCPDCQAALLERIAAAQARPVGPASLASALLADPDMDLYGQDLEAFRPPRDQALLPR